MPAFSCLSNSLLLVLALLLPCHATPAPSVPWDSGRQGGFVTALCQDRRGHVWATTEDNGVWEFSPTAPVGRQWTQFTAQSTGGGLGDDDCYSLACDRLGRVWCGTGRDGVSVFNGRNWRTYDRLTGPLGCHVTALAVSPTDGSIWMGSELGIARYQDGQGWRYFTRADGLPSDQPDCLAFARDGTLFVGTDCDGIGIASLANNYTTWRHVPGPDALPDTPGGNGLPSALVNCLLVSKGGTIYCGTDCGLARSPDGGSTWRFLRGADWKDKLAGLETPVPPRDVDTGGRMLAEDYVTALAEDGAGRLYVGHRQKGLGVYDERTAQGVATPGAYGGYVKDLLPTSQGHLLIGTYGDGLTVTDCAPTPAPALAFNLAASLPPLPAPATPPSLGQMQAMRARLAYVLAKVLPIQPAVTALDPDWATQGTWVDRYGDFAAVLCNMGGGGNDQVSGYHAALVDHRAWMGHNSLGDDFLRYYMTWPHTDDPRCLQNVLHGGRTQAEYDDHGEEKATSLDGPNVYCTLSAPKGSYILSVYDTNKDGHDGDNRFRDYMVTVKVTPMTQAQFLTLGSPVGTPGREQEALFNAAPLGATARVHDFWGGVWQRFYVNLTAPGTNYVTVQMDRNHSFNTILCGIFLDPVQHDVAPSFMVTTTCKSPDAQNHQASRHQLNDDMMLTVSLLKELRVAKFAHQAWYEQYGQRFVLSEVRRLLDKNIHGDSIAVELARSCLLKNVRPEIADCLSDVQLFQEASHVYYSPDHYASWTWQAKTQLGEEHQWDYDQYRTLFSWDYSKYFAFVADQQKNQSW